MTLPDLTTVSAVKTFLAIPAAQASSDPLLAKLITAISAEFLRAIDRTDFLQNTYVELREGDGGTRLTLRHWPIASVTSLKVGATAVSAATADAPAGFSIDTQIDPERRNQLYLTGSVFTDNAVVAISYVAGYAAAPDDVEQAVTEWVGERYKGRPGSAISSQRDAGGEHVAYEREQAMPPTTAAVVERYKRKWPSLDRRNDDRDYKITRINRTYTEKAG